MCGISGIINFGVETLEAQNIRSMTSELRHRGPDDEGYLLVGQDGCQIYAGDETGCHADPRDDIDYIPEYHIEQADGRASSVTFGHRRLSILDLSMLGHQPMSYMDRYWIVHNGEIYNYLELRSELQHQGYSFRSQSDTEVVMAAYHAWGSDCLSRFNGMWAFAIYDSIQNRLFISRDRFGIKPLSYYFDKERLIFASELKALLKHQYILPRPNVDYVNRFLNQHPAEYLGETAFDKLYHFPPATYLELDLSHRAPDELMFRKYWRLKHHRHNEKVDEAQAQLYAGQYLDLLDDAVRLRLRADVKTGSAFSGGLDSSSVVYLVNKHLRRNGAQERQQTFSTVYKSPETRHCDESRFIDELSHKLKIKSNQIEPTPEMVQAEYERMVYAMDTPQDCSLMCCMFTYKLVASSDVTVTLDGQGADELQGGYLRYLVNYLVHLPLRELKKEAGRFMQIPGARGEITIGILFNLVRRLHMNSIFLRLLRFAGKFRDPFLSLNERLSDDFIGNLVSLLHFGDRSSMAHSIETRYPFLDYRMVEFWFSLPGGYKLKEGWTKYVARLAFNGKLPDNITWRKDKMGWEMPQDHWFRGELKEWVRAKIQGSKFLQDIGADVGVVRELDSKQPDHKALKKVIKLLNLAIWYDIFIENGRKASRSSFVRAVEEIQD